MKRKSIIIMFLLFAFGLVSCKKEILSMVDKNRNLTIGIQPSAAMTKAAIDGTGFPSDRSLIISAYLYDAEMGNGNYFDGITFNNEAGVWESDKCYPHDGYLNMFCLSYDGLSISDLTYDANVTNGVSMTVPDNSSQQVDILHGYITEAYWDGMAEPVTMRHAGSVICFIASTDIDDYYGYGVIINDITVKNLKNSGNLRIASQASGGNYCTWTNLGNQRDMALSTYSGGTLNYAVPETAMDITSTWHHFGIGGHGILIPEQSQTSIVIDYTLQNGVNNDGEIMEVQQRYTYICSGNYEEGKKYVYHIKFNFGGSGGGGGGGYGYIAIDPSVEDWSESGATGIDISN